MSELPEWCCASGCRHCDAWREVEAAQREVDETATAHRKALERRTSANGQLAAVMRGHGAKK